MIYPVSLPGAWLGNYNVFPGDVLNARSQDILGAVEAGVEDGMDVLNMSLGGTPFLTEENDLLAVGVNNAVDAGVVVAIASGNSGPGLALLVSGHREQGHHGRREHKQTFRWTTYNVSRDRRNHGWSGCR